MKPMDTAVYWIEYVIRTNGARHLRVVGTTLPWYKYYLVDVIAFLVVSSMLMIYAIFKFMGLLARLFARKDKIKIKKS